MKCIAQPTAASSRKAASRMTTGRRALSLAVALAVGLAVGCDQEITQHPTAKWGPAANLRFQPRGVGGLTYSELLAGVCATWIRCNTGNLRPQQQDCVSALEGSLPRGLPLQSLALLIIDPQSFMRCFQGMDCDQLRGGESLALGLTRCSHVASLSCVGSTLRVCDTRGACRSLGCDRFCDGGSGRCAGSTGNRFCVCDQQQPIPSPEPPRAGSGGQSADAGSGSQTPLPFP